MTVKEHKKLKNLKSQNLRDHMSEAELIFTALAELSTRQIASSTNAEWMKENKVASKKWWAIAKQARQIYVQNNMKTWQKLEDQTGKSVITWENLLPKQKEKREKSDQAEE